MILGMSLATFVLVHVVISLIAIVAGLVVMFGMLGSNRQPGLTAIFLLFTILTSATGFLIPPLLSEKLLPSHIVGILSLVLLAIACVALYGMKISGAWRSVYVVTAMTSLYLNVFVLIIQAFLKVPALHALARTRNLDQQPPDSGFDAARRPGMTERDASPSFRKGVLPCPPSRPKTAPKSITKTGARVSPSYSAMVGRCRPMTGTRRCCSSSITAIGSSPMTAAATAAPARRLTAMTWITMPTTLRL